MNLIFRKNALQARIILLLGCLLLTRPSDCVWATIYAKVENYIYNIVRLAMEPKATGTDRWNMNLRRPQRTCVCSPGDTEIRFPRTR